MPAEDPLKFTADGKVEFSIPVHTPAGNVTSSVDSAATAHVKADGKQRKFDVELILDPSGEDTTQGTTTIS